jgi:hypothetical protein
MANVHLLAQNLLLLCDYGEKFAARYHIVSRGPGQEPQAHKKEMMEKQEGRPLILIVDDEPLLLLATERAMRQGGFRTLAASNAPEALELVRSQPHKIDLLLTDVRMPEVSGLDLAKEFMFSYPDTKILFMSGSMEIRDSFHQYEEFQDKAEFLEKPFSISDLRGKISELLSSP